MDMRWCDAVTSGILYSRLPTAALHPPLKTGILQNVPTLVSSAPLQSYYHVLGEFCSFAKLLSRACSAPFYQLNFTNKSRDPGWTYSQCYRSISRLSWRSSIPLHHHQKKVTAMSTVDCMLLHKVFCCRRDIALICGNTCSPPGASSGNSAIVVLRICRIFRVTRVFKFARRSENLLILIKAVGNTYKELILLSGNFIPSGSKVKTTRYCQCGFPVVLQPFYSAAVEWLHQKCEPFVSSENLTANSSGVVSLAVVSFGSIMYTIESLPKPCSDCEKTQFNSILKSCWWAVITVTTVGKSVSSCQ